MPIQRQYMTKLLTKLCDVYQINASIKNLNEKSLTDVLLHGSDRFNYSKSKQTLLHTICYIQATKYFERPLFDQCYFRSITTVVFFSNMPAKALSTI